MARRAAHGQALLLLAALGLAGTARAQNSAAISFPPDTAHWELEGRAAVVEHEGRPCLRFDGGAAILKAYVLRDGVIDFDVSVAATARRGFIGLQFRLDDSLANAECIYLRPHHSGQPDAIQYTPVLSTGLNWQLYNGPGFTAAVDIPRDEWFHVRVAVTGAQATLWVRDMEKPALVMDDLKSGRDKGRVAIWVLTGETYYSNFTIRSTPDAPWKRHEPPMPPGTLVRWQISRSLEALARDREQAMTTAERDTMHWQDVVAEPPGIVPINRWRASPHLRVTFEGDFSKRLEPQPGMQLVYARTTIDSDRDQVRKLFIGYSDEVTVFLNGKVLYTGRSAQSFRDPAFLGIVNAENDALWLPLRQGRNDLVLAVSELGGGWGFLCRWADGR